MQPGGPSFLRGCCPPPHQELLTNGPESHKPGDGPGNSALQFLKPEKTRMAGLCHGLRVVKTLQLDRSRSASNLLQEAEHANTLTQSHLKQVNG